MKILNLTLKRQWFDMILSGEKKEEYREIKDYWARRLLRSVCSDGIEWAAWEEMLRDLRSPLRRHRSVVELLGYFGVVAKRYDAIRFRNGYAKNAPEFVIELNDLAVKQGREEWGAEKDKYYFTLQLGDLLEAARAA